MIFVLGMSYPAMAIIGTYINKANPIACDMLTKYQDGSIRRCSAVKISDRALLSVKHCDEEAIFKSEKVKKIETTAYCPHEKPRKIVSSELHNTADIGVFVVDHPFEESSSVINLSASDSDEQELIRSGKCSAWGYGPDNQGKSGALKGVGINLIPSTKIQPITGSSKSPSFVQRPSLIHHPFKEGVNYIHPGVEGISTTFYLHPFLYLEASNGFEVRPGDSGGPIFCENIKGDIFLVGLNLSEDSSKVKNGQKVKAKAVPTWPYSGWINKIKKNLLRNRAEEPKPSRLNHRKIDASPE